MKNIIFFLMAFFSTGVIYSQDSAERKATAKSGNVNISHTNYASKSNLDQSTKGIASVNSTDTIPHQTSGDYNDKRRITISENGVKDEPK